MQAIQITDIKGCMNQMLLKDTFDYFLLNEATITTKSSFVLDGAYVEGYYSEEEIESMGEQPAFIKYGELRPICLDIIKGKKTPSYFKFVFSAPKDIVQQLVAVNDIDIAMQDIASLALNLKYQNDILILTTGISLKIFTMDKSLERAWDAYAERFLTDHAIEWEKIS